LRGTEISVDNYNIRLVVFQRRN